MLLGSTVDFVGMAAMISAIGSSFAAVMGAINRRNLRKNTATTEATKRGMDQLAEIAVMSVNTRDKLDQRMVQAIEQLATIQATHQHRRG